MNRSLTMKTQNPPLPPSARDEIRTIVVVLAVLAALLGMLMLTTPAKAEYGDVVINNYSDEAGMRPVVFPHWFHRLTSMHWPHQSRHLPHHLFRLLLEKNY